MRTAPRPRSLPCFRRAQRAHSGESKTLEDAGISGELMGSGRYNFRTRLRQMDHETRAGQIRKLGAAPDFMLAASRR